MLLEEFDVEKYERAVKAEGREEGRIETRNEDIDKLISALKSCQSQTKLLQNS